MPRERFHAIVLAADRKPHDAVARLTGASCKALAPIRGRPMLLRVLDALEASGSIETITLCGPPRPALDGCPELNARIDGRRVRRVEELATPSRSAEAALAELRADAPVLLTTADHALLSPQLVTHFIDASREAGGDATVGLVRHALVQKAFPQSRRTVLRFRDAHYCSCNLFAFLTAPGRSLAATWKQVEERRKRPWRVIAGMLGVWQTAAYLAGWLPLDAAVRAASRRLGLTVSALDLPFAEAGVDVDTAEDYALVEQALARINPG